MLKSNSRVLGKTYTGDSPAKTKGKGRPFGSCGSLQAAFYGVMFSAGKGRGSCLRLRCRSRPSAYQPERQSVPKKPKTLNPYCSKSTSLLSRKNSSATKASAAMPPMYQPSAWMPKLITRAEAMVGANAPPTMAARL